MDKNIEKVNETERKPVVAYIVKRFEDGGINVTNADIEGTTALSSEALYKDIEEVAETIKLKRIENAAYAGARKFYQDLMTAQTQAEQKNNGPEL